jgi:hypothetical protein
MADATCVRRAKENNRLNINTQRNLAINDRATPRNGKNATRGNEQEIAPVDFLG